MSNKKIYLQAKSNKCQCVNRVLDTTSVLKNRLCVKVSIRGLTVKSLQSMLYMREHLKFSLYMLLFSVKCQTISLIRADTLFDTTFDTILRCIWEKDCNILKVSENTLLRILYLIRLCFLCPGVFGLHFNYENMIKTDTNERSEL